jgi:transposase InsO family protein
VRHVYTTNDQRAAALARWLDTYNNRRRHTALGGQPPRQPTHVTNLMAEYS